MVYDELYSGTSEQGHFRDNINSAVCPLYIGGYNIQCPTLEDPLLEVLATVRCVSAYIA